MKILSLILSALAYGQVLETADVEEVVIKMGGRNSGRDQSGRGQSGRGQSGRGQGSRNSSDGLRRTSKIDDERMPRECDMNKVFFINFSFVFSNFVIACRQGSYVFQLPPDQTKDDQAWIFKSLSK